MSWVPGTYGFDTRADYEREVARKKAAGTPLTHQYIPPSPATGGGSVGGVSSVGGGGTGLGGSPLTAAEKAAELGATEFMSQASGWQDPAAYQRFMQGTQDLGLGTTGGQGTQELDWWGSMPNEVRNLLMNALQGGQQHMMPSYHNQYSDLLNSMLGVVQGYGDTLGRIEDKYSHFMDRNLTQAMAALGGSGMSPESTPAGRMVGAIGEQAGRMAYDDWLKSQNHQLQALLSVLGGHATIDDLKFSQGAQLLPYTDLTALQRANMPLQQFSTIAPYLMGTWGDRAAMIQALINNVGIPGEDAADLVDWLLRE